MRDKRSMNSWKVVCFIAPFRDFNSSLSPLKITFFTCLSLQKLNHVLHLQAHQSKIRWWKFILYSNCLVSLFNPSTGLNCKYTILDKSWPESWNYFQFIIKHSRILFLSDSLKRSRTVCIGIKIRRFQAFNVTLTLRQSFSNFQRDCT